MLKKVFVVRGHHDTDLPYRRSSATWRCPRMSRHPQIMGWISSDNEDEVMAFLQMQRRPSKLRILNHTRPPGLWGETKKTSNRFKLPVICAVNSIEVQWYWPPSNAHYFQHSDNLLPTPRPAIQPAQMQWVDGASERTTPSRPGCEWHQTHHWPYPFTNPWVVKIHSCCGISSHGGSPSTTAG